MTLRLVVDSEEAVAAWRTWACRSTSGSRSTAAITGPGSIPSAPARWSWRGGWRSPIRCLRRHPDPFRARLSRPRPGRRSPPRGAGAAGHGGLRGAAAEAGDRGAGGQRGLDSGDVRGASLDGVTEARPGNYASTTSCRWGSARASVRDCAVTVLASVVSARPDGATRCVVDAGALALSKDRGLDWTEPPTHGRGLRGLRGRRARARSRA